MFQIWIVYVYSVGRRKCSVDTENRSVKVIVIIESGAEIPRPPGPELKYYSEQ